MIASPLAFGHVDREVVLGEAPQDAHGAHDTEMLSDAEFLEQFDAGTLDLASLQSRGALPRRVAVPAGGALPRRRRTAAPRPQAARHLGRPAAALPRDDHGGLRPADPPPDAVAERPAVGGVQGAIGRPARAGPRGPARPVRTRRRSTSPEARKTFVPPPAWNIEPVERFLREFTAWQEDLDARQPDDARDPACRRVDRRRAARRRTRVRDRGARGRRRRTRGATGTAMPSASTSRHFRNVRLTSSRCCRVAAPS